MERQEKDMSQVMISVPNEVLFDICMNTDEAASFAKGGEVFDHALHMQPHYRPPPFLRQQEPAVIQVVHINSRKAPPLKPYSEECKTRLPGPDPPSVKSVRSRIPGRCTLAAS